MSISKFMLLLITLLAVMASAFAAPKSREIAIDGNYVKVEKGASASLLNVSLGQFLTPQVVIVTNLSTQRNFAYTATSIGLGGKFFFIDGFRGDLVPFAGIGIALRQRNAAITESATQTDLNLGLAYFLTESATLDAKVKFYTYSDSSDNIYLLALGFSHRF